MKKEDLIIGNYYFIKAFGKEYLFKMSDPRGKLTHMNIKDQKFSRNGWHFYEDNTACELREATSLEARWLALCEEKDKGVPCPEEISNTYLIY